MRPFLIGGLAAALLLYGCAAAPARDGQHAEQEERLARMHIEASNAHVTIDALRAKALAAGDGTLVAAEILSGDQALAVYAAAPEAPAAPRGTVLFVHGYMASVGSSGPAIRALLGDGWLVVALDLPGHGKSGGARFDIGDFSEYGAAVRLVADALAETPGPLALVGHSLGAASILRSLEGLKARPEALVLIAPLLRIRAHGLASFGAALATPFTKTLPGGTPVRWFYAYKAWSRADPAPALNAALARGMRAGFVLCGGDEAVSNAAAVRLAKRAAGSTLATLEKMSHWEIDKKEPDPRLWAAALAMLNGPIKEAR